MYLVLGAISLRVPCRQCCSVFLSHEELELHEQVSHNTCTDCDRKFPNWATLKAHCREFRCAFVCEGCDGIWRTAAAFTKHEEAFNVCKTCQRHFNTPSNLIHHELTHRKPVYECLACPRQFTTYSGMIIHLESGACASRIDAYDLAKTTAICFQGAKFFIYKEDREAIKQGFDRLQELREEGLSTLVFRCPTCDHEFPKLSAMFMHVESPACSQELYKGAVGKLQQWLFNSHATN